MTGGCITNVSRVFLCPHPETGSQPSYHQHTSSFNLQQAAHQLTQRRNALRHRTPPGLSFYMLIGSHGSVRAAHVPPFLLQHGIEVLVSPLALKPHILAKMPFATQTEALK